MAALLDHPRYELHHHRGPDCYDATDHHLHRRVLLTRPSVALNASEEALFLREARILGRLSHPSIPLLHDMGHLDGRAFFITENSEGRTLDSIGTDAADSQALPSLLRAFLAACSAASHAHEREIVHGAIDPASIRLGAFGRTWLMGWQNARSLKIDPRLARGASQETAPLSPFSAPEQLDDKTPDARTDVWGLGAVLHWILWGQPPTPRQGQAEADEPTANGRFTPPAELVAVARRALKTRPSRRYQTVEDLAADVRGWLDGRGVSVVATGFTRAAWRLARRHRASATVVAGASLLVLGGGALTLTRVAASWSAAHREESETRRKRDQAREDRTSAETRQSEAEARADQALSRTLFEKRLELARAKATARDPLEPQRLFDVAEELARQLGPADLARLLRHRGEWYLRAGRPGKALKDFDELVAIEPRDPEGQLGRFLAERRTGGAPVRDIEADALAAMANLPEPLAQISALMRPLHEAEATFAQNQAQEVSDLAQQNARQLTEQLDELSKQFPDMALLHELRSRAFTCLAGRGYQQDLKQGSRGHFENSFLSAVRAISLDPVEPRSRRLLTSQWTEKYGLHESWRWIAGWYHRHLAEAARLSQRPEPLIDLLEAVHLAGQAKATLAPCERLLDMWPSPPDGDENYVHAQLLQARARLTNGLNVQEALAALTVPVGLSSEWRFLLGRDQLIRGETRAGLQSLNEGIDAFVESQNRMLAQADLIEALLDPRADRQALLAMVRRIVTPGNDRNMIPFVAVRLTLLTHLKQDARQDIDRLARGPLSAASLSAVLLSQGYARAQLRFNPADPTIHVQALRAWVQSTFFPVTRAPFLQQSRELIQMRLRRLGYHAAAEAFDIEPSRQQIWKRRIWEPPIFTGAPTGWEDR